MRTTPLTPIVTTQVPSGEALLRMARVAETNGVKYVCGRSGTAVRVIYDDTTGTCTGILTADGSTHTADIVILANGAQIPTLIEAKDEVEASGSAVAVIQLTPAEAEKYKDIPIIDDFEQGDSAPQHISKYSVNAVLLTSCLQESSSPLTKIDY